MLFNKLSPKHVIISIIVGVTFCILMVFLQVEAKGKVPDSPIIGKEIGNKMPSFVLTDLEGKKIALEEIKEDKIILFNIWATWCPACVQFGIPEVISLHNQYKDKDVVFVGISLQEKAHKVRTFIKSYNNKKKDDKKKIDYLMLLDEKGEFSFYFRPQPLSIPAYIIVDKKGVVRYNNVKQSFIDFDKILDMLIAESKDNTKK